MAKVNLPAETAQGVSARSAAIANPLIIQRISMAVRVHVLNI